LPINMVKYTRRLESVSSILGQLSITLLLSHCCKLRTFSWYSLRTFTKWSPPT